MRKIYIRPQTEIFSMRTEGALALASQVLTDTKNPINQQTVPNGDLDGTDENGYGSPSGAKGWTSVGSNAWNPWDD